MESLGHGSAGAVFRARRDDASPDVALKVIHPGSREREEVLARFEIEVRTMGGLNHPHILRVLDYGSDGPLLYIASELKPGGTLLAALRRHPLPISTIVRWAEQIASALDHAHQHGVVHRDVKPQNVLLDAARNVFIGDFGVAKLHEPGPALTQTGIPIGTPSYMAPEQWKGLSIDLRTDIYAFGVLLFHLLTARLPFEGASPYELMHQHVNAPIPDVTRLRTLPAPVGDVLKQALAKDPTRRFQSAGLLAQALRRAVGGQRSAYRKPPAKRALVAMAALAGFFIAGGAVTLWLKSRPSAILVARGTPRQYHSATEPSPEGPRAQQDVSVLEVAVKSPDVVPDLVWSSTGRFMFVLEKWGRLRKISVPRFGIEREASLGVACGGLSVSSQGLLVLASSAQELWIVDEDSLKVRSKIPVGTASSVTSSRALSQAYVVTQTDDDRLSLVDLRTAMIVKEFSARQVTAEQRPSIARYREGAVLSGFRIPTVTHDGRFLFCEAFGSLHRFAIRGRDLVHEETGPRILRNALRIEVSPDSRRVCVPSGGGYDLVSGHPRLARGGTFIYDVGNLQYPTLSVDIGGNPTALGFDLAAGNFYTQDTGQRLSQVSDRGFREKEYTIWNAGYGDTARQLLVHPDGKKLFVLTGNHLFWVELP